MHDESIDSTPVAKLGRGTNMELDSACESDATASSNVLSQFVGRSQDYR